MPLIVGAAEWAGVEQGLIQRARLLEAVAADLYGPQTLVAGGAILGDGSVGLILDVDSVVRAPRLAVPLATSTQLVQA